MESLRVLHYNEHALIIKRDLKKRSFKPAVMSEIRAVCKLSFDKLVYINRALFSDIVDPENQWERGHWERRCIGHSNLKWPSMSSRNAISKYQDSLASYYRPASTLRLAVAHWTSLLWLKRRSRALSGSSCCRSSSSASLWRSI